MHFGDVRVIESSDANVLKYVFSRSDAVAEAVLYKYPTYEERTVICCSTQSGCPIGCRFCGSGDYFVRSLNEWEIIEQPVRLLRDTGVPVAEIKRLQIMFMSMGEPLLNLKELVPAMRRLYELYPNAALLISTSAPRIKYAEVRQISQQIPTIGLQFSVHESTDKKRDALIPFANKLTLSEIAQEGRLWNLATDRKPFFNYCAHDGNNTDIDADRLSSLFDPTIWNATISVICERNESVAAANARQFSLASEFSGKLVERGFNTRVFNPAGQDDIGGGCGQLWFVQSWMREHPKIARPSVGHGLTQIHTPCSQQQ